MASSLELGSAAEYAEWLRLYALALAQQHAVRRARELCDDLLGPLDAAASGAASGAASAAGAAASGAGAAAAPLAWQPAVLGLSKRELLKHTVLPSLATNRALQRLLAEYLETLEATL